MNTERLSAFTDGVMAIIITIMVLELRPPGDPGLSGLMAQAPRFLSYLLSFVYVGIYWTNHHHFFTLVNRVNGAILWANLHVLFWLSLVPFATAWMGEHPHDTWPVAIYGGSLLAPAIAWYVLQATILASEGPASALRRALGRDLKGTLSPVVYLAGIGAAFVNPGLADLLYVAVALMWLVPDRRIERRVEPGAPGNAP